MTRKIEDLFGGIFPAPHQIPFTYISQSGGETSITLPFYPIGGFVTINSGVQVPVDNFDITDNVLSLGSALQAGDVVYCLFDKILSPVDTSSRVRIYKFLSVGGETSFIPDFSSYGVQSLFIDGKYKIPDTDYSYNPLTNIVTLASPLTASVWVVAEMNVKENSAAQAKHLLNLDDNNRQQWTRLCSELGLNLVSGSFELGASLSSATDVIWQMSTGKLYQWTGSFSKTVPINSTPTSTGGVGVGAWLSVGDAALRQQLANSAAGNGADLVGFIQGLTTNYAARTVMDKLRDTVFIDDFYKPEDGEDYGHALNRAFAQGRDLLAINVQFRAQEYVIRTPAVYNGTANVSLTGCNGTKFILQGSGLEANISITSVRRITLQNFQFEVVAPSVDGTKIGWFIRCTGQDRSPTMLNITGETTITSESRSVIMYDIKNFALASIRDCYARYFGGALARRRFSNNIAWRIGNDGGSVTTDSVFDNCSVIDAEYAYLVTPPVITATAALEGIAWNNCTIVTCLHGVAIIGDRSNEYHSPMYRWLGGHISAYRVCFLADWVSQFVIANANFYLTYVVGESDTGSHTAIILNSVYQGHVNSVSFNLFNQQDDFGMGVNVLNGCRSVQVSNCSLYNSRRGYVVISEDGAINTRVIGNAAYYPGATGSSVLLRGAQDEDLGGNTARVG